jgi:tetratricopeptide (TPR) repeat protein
VSKQKFASLLLIFVCLVFAPAVIAQKDDPERKRAFELYDDAQWIEALPLFEKLAVRYPEDGQVIEALGMLLIGQTAYVKDAEARKTARKRGRELLVKAQSLGVDNALLKSTIETIPPDGGNDTGFSLKKEVDEAMREGEAAFARNDMPKALEMYQRALLLDPKLYEAALFAGDVYYKTAEQKKASEWFARAAGINPDRETAYRYWGDSLMKQGRVTEAGDKFVEAYIAEPYSRLARAAFINWANKIQINLAHPEIEVPTNVTPNTESKTGNTSITIDPNTFKKDDKSGAAWMIYGFTRASWVQTEFAKNYPEEKKYRHSLKEEAAAMRSAIKVLEEKKVKDPNSIDKSLLLIMKLDKEGLLESFILLAMPDEGIAQDFVPYRRTNVENLRRYVKDYVLTGGAGPKKP